MADFNGDDYADLALGEPLAGELAPEIGRIGIYYGSAAGVFTEPNGYLQINSPGLRMGNTLATGDINGDGYADVVTGANEAIFVFYGGQYGFSPTVHYLTTPQEGARFGSAVLLEDFDGDGHADAVVGAPGYRADPGMPAKGMALLFRGIPWGLDPNLIALSPNSTGNVGDFGASLASGDGDGDERPDLAVGAPSGNGAVFWFDNAATRSGGAPKRLETGRPNERFGWSLAFVNLDDQRNPEDADELLVGAPRYRGDNGREVGGFYRFDATSSGP